MQADLAIGKPGDPYEREADRIADLVTQKPASCSQALGDGWDAGSSERTIPGQGDFPDGRHAEAVKAQVPVQAEGSGAGAEGLEPGIEAGVLALEGGGHPLPQTVRDYFEPRFARDFGGVRIHTSREAMESAASLKARAFTIGNDIFFGRDNYRPDSAEGRRLLAHELTHVLQQGAADDRAFRLQPEPTPAEKEPPEEPGLTEKIKLTFQCLLENDEFRNKLINVLIEKYIPKKYKDLFEYVKKNEALWKALYEQLKEKLLPQDVKEIIDILEKNPWLRKLIIQKFAESLPWEEFLIFLGKYVLAPFFSVENLSEETKQLIFKLSSNFTLAVLLNEFRTGTGEKERVFDASHPVTQKVAESSAVKEALSVFYKANSGITQFKDLKPLKDYEYKFSPKGDEPYFNVPKSIAEHVKGSLKVAQEWNWVDLFLGGVFVTILPAENNLLSIEVMNDIGKESLMLHAVPDLPESVGNVPYRTTIQKFVFFLPFDPDYLKKSSACEKLSSAGVCP